MITMLVGWISSLATSSPDDAFDAMLLHPLIHKWSLCCPGKERTYISEVPMWIEEEETPSPKQY